ncbi:MAG TPA: hypothetical protein VMV50_00880 [Candidatus Paceibacterota bacterium]|nr:hypothetical protein [Candidatus Paceibacterota bacterium]
MWQDWTNGVLGLAVLVAAFMGLTGTATVWTFSILGALIAILGFWGAGGYSSGTARTV